MLIDIAAKQGVDALRANFPITSKELQAALAAQKMDVEPGDIVFVRTGTLRYWGEMPLDRIAAFLGVPLTTVKWRLHRARALVREYLRPA